MFPDFSHTLASLWGPNELEDWGLYTLYHNEFLFRYTGSFGPQGCDCRHVSQEQPFKKEPKRS